MDTELLVATLVFIIPMCFTPGPNNVLCAAHGSQHGLRGTLPLITGMAIGWSSLGLFVGAATVFIEENESFFSLLTYVGAAYIAYLAYKIATAKPITDEEQSSERLGVITGIVLQVVNGKAWIHFLVLMTAFGSLFGAGFEGKVALVLLNLLFGLPAVTCWAAFGTLLRRAFSNPSSARNLNRAMGLSLFAVAVWIVLSH
ncbi:LysE family translocator [Candidatus Thalassarchaeum betae]|uniref:LysE family translocator n=1 Tax=Candidatus Thalassarchaeum betae TaxID=2599289 RepID=UPI0030C697D1|nr:LysE family translocator [Candidatus Thalassoarchaea betae]